MHTVHIPVNAEYAYRRIQPSAHRAHNWRMAEKPRRKTYLREWRRMKPGRTLEQVAAELHMSQPQLGRIERGDQPYNQDLLEALAALYGCTVADLLIRDPSDPTAIWSIWENARPGEKRMIAAAAEAILKTGTEGDRH